MPATSATAAAPALPVTAVLAVSVPKPTSVFSCLTVVAPLIVTEPTCASSAFAAVSAVKSALTSIVAPEPSALPVKTISPVSLSKLAVISFCAALPPCKAVLRAATTSSGVS